MYVLVDEGGEEEGRRADLLEAELRTHLKVSSYLSLRHDQSLQTNLIEIPQLKNKCSGR